MPEHLHTVKIVGTPDDPKIEFTCHGGRDAACHRYPDCQCETWSSDESEHEHPYFQQDRCWMQDWFDNDGSYPSSESLSDVDYRPGMSGPITASWDDECVEWEFIEEARA